MPKLKRRPEPEGASATAPKRRKHLVSEVRMNGDQSSNTWPTFCAVPGDSLERRSGKRLITPKPASFAEQLVVHLAKY